MKMLRPVLTAFAVTVAWPLAAHADAMGAVQARDAIDRGAQAWDVRTAGVASMRLVPGAVQADLAAWARTGNVDDLARAVSAAGIDLSRDVVVYGAAGDARAQALVEVLASVATGQVHWLVGGIDEWQGAGLPTVAQAAVRWPVPQRLVTRPADEALSPAAATLRRSAAPSPAVIAARG